MFKKIVLMAALVLVAGSALASVEVNKADQSGLDGIKGIGPSLSKAILAERSKGGDFKDWSDLEHRVKGISDKNSVRFSNEGLVVNGQVKDSSGASIPVKNSKAASGKDVGAGAVAKD